MECREHDRHFYDYILLITVFTELFYVAQRFERIHIKKRGFAEYSR